jgi:DNA polymerase/3'-5' exonuclease PolX
MKETIGDIDFLVELTILIMLLNILSLPQMEQIIAKGETKVFEDC